MIYYECNRCFNRRIEEECCFLVEESGEPISKELYLRGEGKCYCAICGYDILKERGLLDGEDRF